jgi:hypothetical protein
MQVRRITARTLPEWSAVTGALASGVAQFFSLLVLVLAASKTIFEGNLAYHIRIQALRH